MNANGTTTSSPSSTSSRRPLRKRSSSNIGGNHRGGDLPSSQPIAASRPFLVLVALLGFALAIQFVIVFSWHHGRHDVHVLGKLEKRGGGEEAVGLDGEMRQQQQQHDLQQQQQQLRQKAARDNDVQNEILTGDEMQNHGQDGDGNSDSNSNNSNSNDLNSNNLNSNNLNSNQFQANYDAHHGYAYDPAHPDNLPPLPPFLNLQSILTHHAAHAEQLVRDTLSGSRPTVTGIALVLQNFLSALHESNRALAARPPPHRAQRDDVHSAFVSLARQHLQPLEDAYRGRSIFPIRDDDSIFISLASFRDHLLGDTLKGAFDQAKRPDRLFVGAVVQNCFGLHPYPGEDGVQCRTGAQVVGKDEHGRDTTKVSDAPPDRNGIDEFCSSPAHRRFCDSGQIRVLYLHENESLGPAMARYYASKLWGGETHFVQVDSHLEFYTHWDDLYVSELRSAKSFPKAILSSYPPGFGKPNDGKFPSDHSPTPGARLCTCEFSTSDVEAQIIRINTGIGYKGTDDEDHPTQIPFIAAGFFFAPAEFLIDVPFDPYMPWCFMGEEIMLSMRAWTHGWDIYAPRWNWIMHQYRPGRMGLPKFWGSVGRLFGRPGPGFSNQLQLKLIKRVKYLVGYEDCCTRERLVEEGSEEVLEEVEHYGFGEVRTRQQYLDWANIDVKNKRCQRIEWCNRGELE